MTEPPITIAGIGLVGGFGLGRQALVQALRDGGKPNGSLEVAAPSGKDQRPAYQADVSSLSRFVPAAALRRMNRFGRLATLGAALAFEDAGWDMPSKRADIGIVVASGYGASKSTFDFLDSIIAQDGQFASPTLFSNSVHSSAASHISIVLRLTGPCLTVSQFEMSAVSGLMTARDWLLEGRVRAVLFGAVDELSSVLGYCYNRFFGADPCGCIEPFAWARQSAVMGEGAAFLLLERDRRTDYGQIDRIAWASHREFDAPPDGTLVLGADGHVCTGRHYRQMVGSPASLVAYSPLFGSLPSGQAFDVAIAAVAARLGLGQSRICSLKCDIEGNCGVVECSFDPDKQ